MISLLSTKCVFSKIIKLSANAKNVFIVWVDEFIKYVSNYLLSSRFASALEMNRVRNAPIIKKAENLIRSSDRSFFILTINKIN